MNKREFLNELESRLQGLPKNEIEERIGFYDEMIQDMVDDGKSEEDVIYSLGSMDDIVRQIAGETKMSSLVKERIKPKRSIGGLEIVLLILGFPLWFPLLIVFLVLMFVGFLLLWVLVIVTYSIEAGLIAGSIGGVIGLAYEITSGQLNIGDVGATLLCIGGALVFLFVCYLATKITFKLTAHILLGIKSRMIGGVKNA
ncbi:MAG: DUF1700 domain-containing protein [Acholeplasmatales bacterium]|nr:DUF1700 domain-containing protein [Acholeplasmatales bacterium]